MEFLNKETYERKCFDCKELVVWTSKNWAISIALEENNGLVEPHLVNSYFFFKSFSFFNFLHILFFKLTCGMCLSSYGTLPALVPQSYQCGHSFCAKCILEYKKNVPIRAHAEYRGGDYPYVEKHDCPVCSEPIQRVSENRAIVHALTEYCIVDPLFVELQREREHHALHVRQMDRQANELEAHRIRSKKLMEALEKVQKEVSSWFF